MRSFLDEARKNPDQNPRVPAFDQIVDKGYDGDEYFLSFTTVKKVGINPSSGYDTPNGIYSYPASEIMDLVRGDMRNVPYANDAPYIHVLKKKGSGIIDPMESYSSGRLAKDINNMFKIIKKSKIIDVNPEMEQYFLRLIEDASKGAKNNSPIAKFWNITRELSNDLVFSSVMGWGGSKPTSFKDFYDDAGNIEVERGKDNKWKSKRKDRNKRKGILKQRRGASHNSQGWNNLLRMLGYNGFVDRSGSGLIHENEPTAAVFLSTKAFTVVDNIMNKSYARITRQSQFENEIEQLEKRNNTVKIIGKINGKAEVAFHQIVDSDISGTVIDFYAGRFFLSGYGSKIGRGSFTSPLIEFESVNIHGGSYVGLEKFVSCVIHGGDFRDMDITEGEILGGDYHNCMFPKVDVISKGVFMKCRFMARMMLFNVTTYDCHLQECGFSQCKINGGYLSNSTLDDNIRVKSGCRMDQVNINGGRYSKSFIERSTVKGGVFHNCRLTDTTVKDGEFSNVTTDNVRKEGGIWNDDI